MKNRIFMLTLLSLCLLIPSSLPVMAQSQSYEVIEKPFSITESENTYGIPIGSTIQHLDNGQTIVYDSTGKKLFYAKDNEAKLITTPNGLQPANHVYQIPSGATLNHCDNTTYVFYNDELILTVIENSSPEIELLSSDLIVQDSYWLLQGRDLDVDNLDRFEAWWDCTK